MGNGKNSLLGLMFLGAVMVSASGCMGTQTFSNIARAGDTVSVAAGIDPLATRDAVTVTVRDSAGSETVYLPGDPRVRAVVNLYPDPSSYFVVGAATGQDFRSEESTYGSYADAWITDSKRDWRQTIAFIDLPTGMAQGQASVVVEGSNGYTTSSRLDILPGVGAPNPMDFTNSGGNPGDRLQSLEHMSSTRVSIVGPFPVKPAAAEYRLSHDPDSTQGGVGRAHVTHARGDLAGVVWHDDGTNLRILVTSNVPVEKFHKDIFAVSVAGGVTGLQLDGATIVDPDGNVLSSARARLSPSFDEISPSGPLVAGAAYSATGRSLCDLCNGSDADFWIRTPNGWVQPTSLNISTNAVTFTMPAGAGTGTGFLWIEHSGGSSILPVQF